MGRIQLQGFFDGREGLVQVALNQMLASRCGEVLGGLS